MPVWSPTVLLLAALPPTGLGAAAIAQTTVTVATDDAAFRPLLDAQTAAWNRGDGDAWAAPFTDDASFINIRGQIVHGRAGVAQLHRMILTGPYQGSHVEIRIRRVLPLAADTALVETDQTVTRFRALPPGVVATSPGALETHMNYIARKSADDTWRFLSAQNTAVLPGVLPPAPR